LGRGYWHEGVYWKHWNPLSLTILEFGYKSYLERLTARQNHPDAGKENLNITLNRQVGVIPKHDSIEFVAEPCPLGRGFD
jgi:hypothetical protein